MKKLKLLLGVFILLSIAICSMTYGDENAIQTEGFTIEDEVLLNALAEYDANADGVLTLEEAKQIKHLFLSNQSIKTMSGIENFVNLTTLYADNCGLETLDYIVELPNLSDLKISNNDFSKSGMVGINRISSLISLDVSGCDLESLDYIVELSNLKELDISNNDLSKSGMTGINELKDLRRLEVRSCGIESLDHIRDLSNLNYLDVSDNNISEIGNISDMQLSSILLTNNNIADIEDFKKIIEGDVTKCYLSGNPVYQEAREYYFTNIHTQYSIIGSVGSMAWQKYSGGDLSAHSDSSLPYSVCSANDFELDNAVYSIEDTSIATIGEDRWWIKQEDAVLRRVFMANSDLYGDTIVSSDKIFLINLLKEGYTRMQVSCGNLTKYVDIWVLPAEDEVLFITDMKQIKEPGYADMFSNIAKTDTGVTLFETIKSYDSLVFHNISMSIVDFTGLIQLDKLTKLTLTDYNSELFEQVKGLEDLPNVQMLTIKNGTISAFEANGGYENVEKLFLKNNKITNINITGGFGKLKYIDLRSNKLEQLDDINIPDSVNEIYLEGNPLPEGADIELFETYMFDEDVFGKAGDKIYLDKIDIVDSNEIAYKLSNKEIGTIKGNELELKGEGIATLEVTYKSNSKLITVVSGDTLEYEPGDVNGDKNINALDALSVLQYSAKIMEYTDYIEALADINIDTKVNAEDALSILKIAAKIEQ